MTAKKKSREMADGIMESVRELQHVADSGADILAHLRKNHPDRVRTVVFRDPGKHTPAMVRRLRDSLNVSQETFAKMVGVSRVLVQSWERGVRKPSPLARRLLDIVSDDPKTWAAKIIQRKAG